MENKLIESSLVPLNIEAGLSITLGPTWCVDTWRHLFSTPSLVAESYANKRKRKHDSDKNR